MGDWEDLCESLGLTVGAEWEDVQRRLFPREDARPSRSIVPAAKLSELDRPQDLPSKVATAFQDAGLECPRAVELVQYAYRFTLPSGGRFDLWYDQHGKPSAFSSFAVSEPERKEIRLALQLYLPRPCPAEMGVWSRSRERAMREAFVEAGFEGLWIDHKPLQTQIVLRKTRYAHYATNPSLHKSQRWGMLLINHAPTCDSTVIGSWGQPDMLQRLKDGLVVFGLLGVPDRDDDASR